MNANNVMEIFLSALVLPILHTFINFAWGQQDPLWLMAAKRTFLLLPVLAMILGYWITVVGAISLVIRSDRKNFINAILVTWWDLGRATFSLWGGVFKFLLNLVTAIFTLARTVAVGTWVFLQDFVLIPFRVVGNVGSSVLAPGVPWIAVGLTVFWCILEAILFTFVTSPLVVDTLGNMTGSQMTESFIRIPLFIFMLFVILGSYAVLTNFSEALKTKNFGTVAKIGAIELVAMTVEVVFLYREFVDALVPWFAQHASGKFDLGITGTLAIAGATWFGIRSMSWFLFAASGTPTLMAIIQGKGLDGKKRERTSAFKNSFELTSGLIKEFKAESAWAKNFGEQLLGSFILPPLQIVAAAVNFCTLLFTSTHLFELPFKDVSDLKDARTLLQKANAASVKRKEAA